MSLALLVLVVVVHYGPEHISHWLGHSQAAWEYVARGIEGAALWGVVASFVVALPARAVATYGAAESGLQSVCRLAFPMDRKPEIVNGQTLCDVAAGAPLGWLSIAAVCFVVMLYDPSRRSGYGSR